MKVPSPLDGKLKSYVTIHDAADLLNVEERTVFRMLKKKRLNSMKAPDGSRWVSLDDIQREQQAKPRSASPTLHQLKQVQTLVAELQELLYQQNHRIQELEQQVTALHVPSSHESLLLQISPQEEGVEGPPTVSLLELAQMVATVQVHASSHQPQGIVGMIAKRNLPVGTQRLADFAKQHQVSIDAIKKGYAEGTIALTIHQREGAVKRNRQEWWITQEQHQPAIAYCRQQSPTLPAHTAKTRTPVNSRQVNRKSA